MERMINRDGLMALYSYNAYANGLLLDTVEKLTEEQFSRRCSPSHGSVRSLLLHMLECEAFFLAQCQGQRFELEVASLPALADIRRQWRQLAEEQQGWITSLTHAGLTRQVRLELRGQELVFAVWELLLQAVVHSVHHRGELSVVCTGLGYPLPTMDIILHFIKQRGQSWPFD
ncbi:MAG: hypothetical protein AMJ93_12005 [Anaerolineae bacterium SM23_84]|nr:MAG: hypothetical protein AMJ93_12005 [Anaerolineae bacterium SM23_84]